MNLPLALALFAATTLTIHADDIRRITLDGAPLTTPPAEEIGKDGLARIKKFDQAALEIFSAAQKPARGTIMVSPGGGYGGLAITHEGRAVAKMLNAAGWDAAVLVYHVNAGPDTRTLALADAKTALTLLQKRGSEFGLSQSRVGAMGFSAGGHLTARLAHETATGAPPEFLVLIYPAYLEKDGKVLDEVAPTKAPTFIFVAMDDKYAPSSVAYAAACRTISKHSTFHKVETGGHGFGMKEDRKEEVRNWPDLLRKFLDSVSAS